VLTNVVENAARATGPQGKVEIRLRDEREPAIDVIDDGPGLGLGPPGTSSLGLLVVTSLLESCGGALEVWSPLAGGTQVSIRLPAAHGDGCAKPEGDAS
jgi:signal transduction histidine kinase